MKPMQTIHDLIEEAKIRALYWALCIFAVTYFLTHTSKSMWLNFPLSLLLVSGLRLLLNMVEVHFKVERAHSRSYLSHLAKKQISIHDSRLSCTITPTRWKRKIDSPIVEAAILELVNKILQDFVTDLWYSEITPDNEAPELMRIVILDALAEVAGRVKELNLVDLLTRDLVDLMGNHLDLFRRNQLAIGIDVMEISSTEERDDRLKHHLINSRQLHPALISAECEYKVLQQFSSGILSVVLRPREAQCRLVRTIARELIASMILQPLMDFVSPIYINEVIEILFLQDKGNMFSGIFADATDEACIHVAAKSEEICNVGEHGSVKSMFNSLSRACHENDLLPGQPGHWAKGLNAANKRRTEVLMPENLEDMWSRGRNYTRNPKSMNCKGQVLRTGKVGGEEYMSENLKGGVTAVDEKAVDCLTECLPAGINGDGGLNAVKPSCVSAGIPGDEIGNVMLRRSISASALGVTDRSTTDADVGGKNNIILNFYGREPSTNAEDCNLLASATVCHLLEAHRPPNIKCRVVGAYFEKISSKSFAVYSIAVTDAEGNTWFVKRRYRNFERLHRHLKDIPNYTLHLPPKRIFSSSTEDAFVHQRCIRLDKYLQDLLSIANVAEQHEVWDFLSSTSKSYSFGKSPSVMRTLAVNVDDAMDDIVRQFKSTGRVRKLSASSSMDLSQRMQQHQEASSCYNHDLDSTNSASDGEKGTDGSSSNTAAVAAAISGWHSDNELNLKGLPARVVKGGDVIGAASPAARESGSRLPTIFCSDRIDSSVAVPPEWTPSKVSVPLLNLVDKVFQLKRRGWLRRQVFWISKQIVQLMMEDAIDDFLLRQIHRIRQEDVIARAVHFIRDLLWPDGVFFMNSSTPRRNAAVSFEVQLEMSRRANDVKKFIFDGPPAALVGLIGHKQYKRCAGDIYYFLQSSVCLKQLMYAILELLLVSLFPELHDLVRDVHRKIPAHPIS